MRNYRAGLAKWQTADPMGYPDGWNQLAYGVNSPAEGVDLLGCSWYWPFGDDETRERVAIITGQSIPIQGALGKTLLCGQSSELTVETQAVSMSIKVSPTINQVTGGLSQALISLVTGQTFTATIDIKPGTEKLPISYTCDAPKHASATSKKGSATFVPEIVAIIWIYAVYNGSEGGTFSDGSNRPVRFETETSYSIRARMIEATECVE